MAFTEKWLLNLAASRDSLSALPRAHSVARALTNLGLSQLVRTHEAHSQAGRGEENPLDRRSRPLRRTHPNRSRSATLHGRCWRAPRLRPRVRSSSARGMRQVLKGMGQSFPLRAARLLARQGRRFRFGTLEPGGGASRRAEGPLAGRDQAEQEDDDAAAGQDQPVGVAGRDETGAQRSRAGSRPGSSRSARSRATHLAAGRGDGRATPAWEPGMPDTAVLLIGGFTMPFPIPSTT